MFRPRLSAQDQIELARARLQGAKFRGGRAADGNGSAGVAAVRPGAVHANGVVHAGRGGAAGPAAATRSFAGAGGDVQISAGNAGGGAGGQPSCSWVPWVPPPPQPSTLPTPTPEPSRKISKIDDRAASEAQVRISVIEREIANLRADMVLMTTDAIGDKLAQIHAHVKAELR